MGEKRERKNLEIKLECLTSWMKGEVLRRKWAAKMNEAKEEVNQVSRRAKLAEDSPSTPDGVWRWRTSLEPPAADAYPRSSRRCADL